MTSVWLRLVTGSPFTSKISSSTRRPVFAAGESIKNINKYLLVLNPTYATFMITQSNSFFNSVITLYHGKLNKI